MDLWNQQEEEQVMTSHDCNCGADRSDKVVAEKKTVVEKGVTRRAAFRGLAAALSTIGLATLADAASAASKRYTACKASEVPVGGAKLCELSPKLAVLVTQPKKGTFRAFSVYCTHQGAVIGTISGSTLVCLVHGAKFDTTTGAVKKGPARKALTRYTATVSSGKVIVTA